MRTTRRRLFEGRRASGGSYPAVPRSARAAPTCTARVERLLVGKGPTRVVLRPTPEGHAGQPDDGATGQVPLLVFALQAASVQELARLRRWQVSGAPVEVWRKGADLDLVQPHTAQLVHLNTLRLLTATPGPVVAPQRWAEK